MAQAEYEIDHIDPKWAEGRDYQLVCGLDRSINLIVREGEENDKKSNRFVPYRVVDWLPVHQEAGDWGVFLIGGEWRLTQFMGREWFMESKKIGCGEVAGGRVAGKKTGWGRRSFDHQSAAGKIGGVSVPLEVRIRNGKRAVALREICEECGRVMSPANMGRHMKQTHGKARVKLP
jgi:hypothetical protein